MTKALDPTKARTRKGRRRPDGTHSITVRRFGVVVEKVIQLPLWRPRS